MFIISFKSGIKFQVKTAQIVGVIIESFFSEQTEEGIPYYIEAESWAELACSGDTFETDRFEIEAL